MFLVRQYAAFVIVAFTLTALLVAACGLGYLLKAAGIMLAKSLPTSVYRARTPKRVGVSLNGRSATASEQSQVMMAEDSS